ncbi:MAG TPA: thiamine-phosphate synthase family protein, partial [Nitrososphaera sp.]|nr:thiamine-phosphate synthase family protein [Nitrososphaera sp.]
ASYDRSKEPPEIKSVEGATVAWGIQDALSRNSEADVIFHEGDIGKEAMIMVFAPSPPEIVRKIERILAGQVCH